MPDWASTALISSWGWLGQWDLSNLEFCLGSVVVPALPGTCYLCCVVPPPPWPVFKHRFQNLTLPTFIEPRFPWPSLFYFNDYFYFFKPQTIKIHKICHILVSHNRGVPFSGTPCELCKVACSCSEADSPACIIFRLFSLSLFRQFKINEPLTQ